MMIRIRAIKLAFSGKERKVDKDKEDLHEANTLKEYNLLPASYKTPDRIRPRDQEWDKERVLPENIDPVLDKMCFELDGYRYDKELEVIIIYTPFEYRLYCPCGEREFIKFSEEIDAAEAHNTVYDCRMLAYYSDPDFHTFQSLNPILHIVFRWFFH